MAGYYSKFHKKAVKSKKFLGKEHARWMYDLLKSSRSHWMLPGTRLPHIDFFDEVTRAVDFKDEVKEWKDKE